METNGIRKDKEYDDFSFSGIDSTAVFDDSNL